MRNTKAYEGYKLIYELDTILCQNPKGWITVAKISVSHYTRKYGRVNIKTYFNYGRYWQIYVRDDALLTIGD